MLASENPFLTGSALEALSGSVVDVLLIDLKHWLQEKFEIYLNSSTTLPLSQSSTS
jgi:pyruvate-formate lyase-activating enzyme